MEIPTIKITPSAEHLVKDVHFDGHRYAEYLFDRGVSESELSLLDLSIDASRQSLGSHATFLPRTPSDENSRHHISFSPRSLSGSIRKQGNALRHETEHFLYHLKHPDYVKAKYVFAGLTSLSSGAILGVDALNKVAHATSELHPVVGIAANTAATLGAAAFGLAGGLSFFLLTSASVGPSETKAQWAERSRRNELPDGTLKIQFR